MYKMQQDFIRYYSVQVNEQNFEQSYEQLFITSFESMLIHAVYFTCSPSVIFSEFLLWPTANVKMFAVPPIGLERVGVSFVHDNLP